MGYVTTGYTRSVILVGPFAIKVAHFRCGALIARGVRFLVRNHWSRIFPVLREYCQANSMRRAHTMAYVRRNCLATNVSANKVEADIWRNVGQASRWQLVPVLAVLGGGLVVVQRRGERVATVTPAIETHPLWRVILVEHHMNAQLAAAQFVLVDGKPLLADYGRQEVREYIEESIGELRG